MSLYVKLPGLFSLFFCLRSSKLLIDSRPWEREKLRLFFFLDAGGEEKRYQSASLTPCQRVTGPHLGKSAALKWNTMPTGTPISYSTWPTVPGHLSVYPAWKTCLVQKARVLSDITRDR